jgi:hypothetical protein
MDLLYEAVEVKSDRWDPDNYETEYRAVHTTSKGNKYYFTKNGHKQYIKLERTVWVPEFRIEEWSFLDTTNKARDFLGPPEKKIIKVKSNEKEYLPYRYSKIDKTGNVEAVIVGDVLKRVITGPKGGNKIPFSHKKEIFLVDEREIVD